MTQLVSNYSFWPGVLLTLIAVCLLVATEIVAQEAGGINGSRPRGLRGAAVACSAAATGVIVVRFVVLT